MAKSRGNDKATMAEGNYDRGGAPAPAHRFHEIIPQGTNIDFMGHAKYIVPFTTALVVISLIWMFTKGFNWGIDFAGGLEMRVEFTGAAQNTKIADVRKALDEMPAEWNLKDLEVSDFVIPGKTVFSIKAKGEARVERAGGDEALHDISSKVLGHLNAKFGEGTAKIVSTDMVGPRVGASLRRQGTWAVVIAMAFILVYIAFRFNWKYGQGAVIALAHDVIITAGMFAVLQREVNLTTIAALLTIAGYSNNDTIVIFDRIREGRRGKYRNIPLREAINHSINETLSRTILTSGVTMLVVIAMLFLGGEILFDFSLAMTVGIVIGTYSSIFIASPLFVWADELTTSRRQRRIAR